MTVRLSRIAAKILDYRTFIVAGAFVLVAVLGVVVVQSLRTAHDASTSADRRSAAASRRIDRLNDAYLRLQRQNTDLAAQVGSGAAANAALATQVRQLGGRPVITISLTSHPAPTSAPKPTPKPTPTPTSKPKPKPTSTPFVCVLGKCHPPLRKVPSK